MGLVRAVAIVWNIPTHDAGAGHITMHQWTRCPRWLEPVDILEIAQSNIGGPAPIPIAMYPDQRFVDLHGPLLSAFPHKVDRTTMSVSYPVQGGSLRSFHGERGENSRWSQCRRAPLFAGCQKSTSGK